LTIAMLMYNTVKAAKMRRGSRMPELSSLNERLHHHRVTETQRKTQKGFLCVSVLCGERSSAGGTLLKVGLTGGIASGKSVVGDMFVALGAHLVQADRIAHELMRPGQTVYNEVVRHFGGGILNPDLSVNRAKLAEAAFGSDKSAPSQVPSRIQELNRIVHPAVIRSQEEWMEEMGGQDPHAVAIVEAALIIEAGAAERFDRLIVVTCSDEQRIARFAARQKLDLEAARKEVAAAWPRNCPKQKKSKPPTM
jgi:dephospho-CoA kinase